MKRVLCLMVVVATLFGSCLAFASAPYDVWWLGVYKIGEDIPHGRYKVKFTGVDRSLSEQYERYARTDTKYLPYTCVKVSIQCNTYHKGTDYGLYDGQPYFVDMMDAFVGYYSPNTTFVLNLIENVTYIEIESYVGGYIEVMEFKEIPWA